MVRGAMAKSAPACCAARSPVPISACGCPVAAFQKMISGKYKLRIVWDLKDGPRRYGEIRTGLLRGAIASTDLGLRLSGGGVSENDQRQIQAADRLGFEGWSAALWRNPHRPVARRDRQYRSRPAVVRWRRFRK